MFSEADEMVLQCKLLKDFVEEGDIKKGGVGNATNGVKREDKRKKKLA